MALAIDDRKVHGISTHEIKIRFNVDDLDETGTETGRYRNYVTFTYHLLDDTGRRYRKTKRVDMVEPAEDSPSDPSSYLEDLSNRFEALFREHLWNLAGERPR